jgi:hypothetical protein
MGDVTEADMSEAMQAIADTLEGWVSRTSSASKPSHNC